MENQNKFWARGLIEASIGCGTSKRKKKFKIINNGKREEKREIAFFSFVDTRKTRFRFLQS
jgi:hypothetical protein